MTVLRRFYSGQRVEDLRAPLNALVDAAKAQGRQRAGPSPIKAIAVREVEIKALQADELTCVDVGMAADMNAFEYTVRPPLTLTELSREAVTYAYTDINTRVADGTENQELTPKYVVGDTILVTHIAGDDGAFRDLNVDGRQWAKV